MIRNSISLEEYLSDEYDDENILDALEFHINRLLTVHRDWSQVEVRFEYGADLNTYTTQMLRTDGVVDPLEVADDLVSGVREHVENHDAKLTLMRVDVKRESVTKFII